MMKMLLWILRIVTTIITAFAGLFFLFSIINGPATPGEGDTATQEEIIKFWTIALFICVAVCTMTWCIPIKRNKSS